MLEVRTHPKRGRGLYTTRDVKGGETLIDESPILLTVLQHSADSVCANCLRMVTPATAGAVACTSCSQAVFCSQQCQQAGSSTPWVHSPLICRAYSQLARCQGLGEEDANRLVYLVHAYCLRQAQQMDPDQRFQKLLSMVGEPNEEDMDLASRLTPVLHAALGGVPPETLPSVEEVATLVRKEQLNSYGILAPAPSASSHPAGPDEELGERQLRGTGLYATPSLINHECNPNVARYEFFDLPGSSSSTHMVFRAMHDLPAGTEITQSYCPLHWEFEERQEQCEEVYGFTCTCARCQLEAEWELPSDGDNAMMDDQAAGAKGSAEGGMDVDQGESMAGASGGEDALDPTYLQLYLLKYVCPQLGCFGTMAPLAAGSDVLECNVCGFKRTETEFLAELDTAVPEAES